MAAYQIIYRNDSDELIRAETVFMKGLRGAKTSAAALAPACTHKIELRDIADRLLASKENNRWKEYAA